MNRLEKAVLCVAISGALLGGIARPVFADVIVVPPSPPAVDVTFAYHYYPDVEVYFNPTTRVYFWFEGGVWVSGPVLPRTIVIRHSPHIVVRLDGDKPYLFHGKVKIDHPSKMTKDHPPSGHKSGFKPHKSKKH